MSQCTHCAETGFSAPPDLTAVGLRGLLAGGLLGSAEAEFGRLVERFRRELGPRDVEEILQFDLIVMAVTMLRRVLAAMATAALGDPALLRTQSQAYRMLRQSLRDFHKLREREIDPEDDEAPATIPIQAIDPALDAAPVAPLPEWRERITFPAESVNENDPATWPLVRDTGLEVEHIMSLLSDSWAPSKVLYVYTELTYDDLRACKACDEAGLAGPGPA